MKKLSVITINLDNATGLQKTLESVFSQAYREFEFVVIDGGSSDGSQELLRSVDNRIDHWLSEKDAGIYQAMNKGIRVATGEFCLFLNSGDCFCDPCVTQDIVPMLERADVFVGRVVYPNGDMRDRPPEKLRWYHVSAGIIPHQAAFIRRCLFKEIGFFREDYRLISDSIFFTEALILHKRPFEIIERPVAIYDCQGVSSLNPGLIAREQQRFLRELPLWTRWGFRAKEMSRRLLPASWWKKIQAIGKQ